MLQSASNQLSLECSQNSCDDSLHEYRFTNLGQSLLLGFSQDVLLDLLVTFAAENVPLFYVLLVFVSFGLLQVKLFNLCSLRLLISHHALVGQL